MKIKFFREIKKIEAKKAKIVKVSNKKVQKKNLPFIFLFSDTKRVRNIFDIIKSWPRNWSKNIGIIIREYDLDTKSRLIFSQNLSKIAKQKNIKVIVGKDINLARKIKADGVHFSDNKKLKSKELSFIKKNKEKYIFSYACHNPKLANKNKLSDFDLLFLSPIFATKSHLNKKPLGINILRKLLIKTRNLNWIYALGGINEFNIKSLININIAGIGAISIFKSI